MKKLLLCILPACIIGAELMAQEIIIQERTLGFCSVDGRIDSSVTGYTGNGYADVDPGVGKSMSWQFTVMEKGNYSLVWRYAIGGNIGDRNARLLINGNLMKDTIFFPYTSDWKNWILSAPVELPLDTGSYKIRIEAYSTSGLANYDYLKVIGKAMIPSACTPTYVLSVKSNTETGGTISYEPKQNYYDQGTMVILRAHANPGYFFQSWTGEETSADSVFTFTIKSNVNAVARFLPIGTRMDSTIIGYATVQDDKGTPYLVTGGALGKTVEVSTLADLQTYLKSPDPYVVKFSGFLESKETITITSDKTLIGVGTQAHLKGIELSINQARNVIIKDMTISHVAPQDAIEINGKSKNIVIDHCDLYADRLHDKDFYDGLLDIKNESSFITISRTTLHDHYKVCLISSGDQQVADSVIRITFHHNYFFNSGSRLPSIRFGRAHIFNNYYKNCDDAINSRMGAWVRIERNYFENVGKAVFTDNSALTGYVQLIENYFGSSSVTTSPVCDLKVPYPYLHILDKTLDVPRVVTDNVKITNVENIESVTRTFSLTHYPNPFNPSAVLEFSVPQDGWTTLKVFNLLGQEVRILYADEAKADARIKLMFDGSMLSSGIYFARLQQTCKTLLRKMVLVK